MGCMLALAAVRIAWSGAAISTLTMAWLTGNVRFAAVFKRAVRTGLEALALMQHIITSPVLLTNTVTFIEAIRTSRHTVAMKGNVFTFGTLC